MSSCFFSTFGGVERIPLPFGICPGEGKGGFGIDCQLRPVFTEELTEEEQVDPAADLENTPSVFGIVCIFSTLTEGVILVCRTCKERH